VFFLKKLFYVLFALALIFSGLWLVVANPGEISLDLFFFSTSPLNTGLIVLLSFAIGCAVGLLVGLNLLQLLRLNNRLYWLKREVRQLQDALGDKR
jgi:hypothetical protein